jgi:hypothetical protein
MLAAIPPRTAAAPSSNRPVPLGNTASLRTTQARARQGRYKDGAGGDLRGHTSPLHFAATGSSVLPDQTGQERYSMSTLLLDTDDLGEAEQVLGQTYGAVRIHGDGSDATHMRISTSCLGSLSIDNAEVDCDITYDAESPDRICLCRPRFGLIEEHVSGRTPNRVGAGGVVALGALGTPFSGRVNRSRCDILMVDRGLFDRVAATGRGRGPGRIRLTDSRPISARPRSHRSSPGGDSPHRPVRRLLPAGLRAKPAYHASQLSPVRSRPSLPSRHCLSVECGL